MVLRQAAFSQRTMITSHKTRNVSNSNKHQFPKYCPSPKVIALDNKNYILMFSPY